MKNIKVNFVFFCLCLYLRKTRLHIMDNLHEFLKTKINYILSQQKHKISCYIEMIAGTKEIADISKEGFYNE